MVCLKELPPGASCRVAGLTIQGPMRRRLLELGLVEGTKVTCLGSSPLGDPSAYLIRGAVIALRARDCSGILAEPEEGAPWD